MQGISESIYLKKKKNGKNVFVSRSMISKEIKIDSLTLYVPIQYVQDYGSMKSYLDTEGIKKYITYFPWLYWRYLSHRSRRFYSEPIFWWGQNYILKEN